VSRAGSCGAGESIEVIRELAAHADIRTTATYTEVSPEQLREALSIAPARPRPGGRSE